MGSLFAVLLDAQENDDDNWKTPANGGELFLPYEFLMEIRLQANAYPASSDWPPGYPQWKLGLGEGAVDLPSWNGEDSNIWQFSDPATEHFTAICGNEKSVAVTAVEVDLGADSDRDGQITFLDIGAPAKSQAPGLVMPVSEMMLVEAYLAPAGLDRGSVTLKAEAAGGSRIQLWSLIEGEPLTVILDTDAESSSSVTWDLSAEPIQNPLWLKAVEEGTAVLSMTYTSPDPGGKEIKTDELFVTIIKVECGYLLKSGKHYL